MNTVDKINYANVGLMLAAACAALALPFELLLFAYAVLGPLHYLTEISWLHQRGYFTEERRDALLLVAACTLLLVLVHAGLEAATYQAWTTAIMTGVFLAAIALMSIPSSGVRWLAVGASFAVGFALQTSSPLELFALRFLPTIVHVYLFTMAFMLLAALRDRDRSSWLALLALLICSGAVLLIPVDAETGFPARSVVIAYPGFLSLNVSLAELFSPGQLGDADALFTSSLGVKIQRFIAFAYTYHYLNWFSKTRVIQWHKIPRPWAVANIALWLMSVGLYAWDYRVGLTALYGLSLLHVILELPLNHRTFAAIGRELAALGRSTVRRA